MRKKLTSFLLAMLCFVIAGESQVLTISGRISDERGTPVPFASVVIKGKTNSGTTSDAQGNFKISASKGDVLEISGVSFATREVTVGTSATIDITLSARGDLTEVVVTALGIKRQDKALGYGVSKVDPNAAKIRTECLNKLAGKVPGVDIRGWSGSTGCSCPNSNQGSIFF